jgi:predicted GIY-YIG superfamily endonuclease
MAGLDPAIHAGAPRPGHECRMRGGWVYIITNRRNGTLYLGVTADLSYRVAQHRDGIGSAFTARYGLTRLVWAERHEDIHTANPARTHDEALTARLEGGADRCDEPGVGGPLRPPRLTLADGRGRARP